MDNSICNDCSSRYICGSSDRCSDPVFYEKVSVVRDDLTKCVIDCNLYKREDL